MAWKCSCGLVNGGTNKYCPGLLTWRDREHKQVSVNSPDWVMAVIAAKELGMNAQEELFAKFFNEEKLLVKDMDVLELRKHREELQEIALEAKARVVAADEELKERKAKTNNKEWLVTDTRVTDSEAINVPALRKARMSKMDRLREQLVKAGIDDSTIKEMVGNLEKKATDKTLKTVTFNIPTTEVSAIQVSQVKPIDEPKEPFNPSSLKFGS